MWSIVIQIAVVFILSIGSGNGLVCGGEGPAYPCGLLDYVGLQLGWLVLFNAILVGIPTLGTTLVMFVVLEIQARVRSKKSTSGLT